MNHLTLTLLNPDNAFLQRFDRTLFNYHLGSDIHKIKKTTISQDYIQEELDRLQRIYVST